MNCTFGKKAKEEDAQPKPNNWLINCIKKAWKIWGPSNIEGWKYILINILGNLFPVWFLFIIKFAEQGFSSDAFIEVISQPYTYLILSVTFASNTLYLWMKRVKSDSIDESRGKSIPVFMIIYAIILFPIIGFYLSKKEYLEQFIPKRIVGTESLNTEQQLFIVPIIYALFVLVLLIYIYFQLRDYATLRDIEKKNSVNPLEIAKNEINNLSEGL